MTSARAGFFLIPILAVLSGRAPAQELALGEALRPGDRILLQVEGEAQLSDTFTVAPGPVLPLPGIGDIPLAGVRRADLEQHLTRELARFLRNPVVHARALIRVAILGEVVRPGFYAVPVELVLADAVMLAGGATRDARLDALRVERGDTLLLTRESLSRALGTGRTLDQLGLRAGDRIVVPRRRDGDALWRVLLVVIPAAIYGVTQIR